MPFNQEGVAPLNQQILADAEPFLEDGGNHHRAYPITTGDRGILATLSGAIARQVRERRLRGEDPAVRGTLRLDFTGSAGQGFGAFLTEGLDVRLQGEANDSVCKSMSGGRTVLVPHPEASYTAETNAILGNGALYGATGGTLLVLGLAGDRFAVRNSGASAVVEGAGHHACEYMTRGAVAILGPVLTNAGAGMTGGCLFLRRERDDQVNRDYLATIPWRAEEEALFRGLVEAHAAETGSRTATALLEDWPARWPPSPPSCLWPSPGGWPMRPNPPGRTAPVAGWAAAGAVRASPDVPEPGGGSGRPPGRLGGCLRRRRDRAPSASHGPPAPCRRDPASGGADTRPRARGAALPPRRAKAWDRSRHQGRDGHPHTDPRLRQPFHGTPSAGDGRGVGLHGLAHGVVIGGDRKADREAVSECLKEFQILEHQGDLVWSITRWWGRSAAPSGRRGVRRNSRSMGW